MLCEAGGTDLQSATHAKITMINQEKRRPQRSYLSRTIAKRAADKARLESEAAALQQAGDALRQRLAACQSDFNETDEQLAQLLASHVALGRGSATLLQHEARRSTIEFVLHGLPTPQHWGPSLAAARWNAPQVRYAVHAVVLELGAMLRANAPALQVRAGLHVHDESIHA